MSDLTKLTLSDALDGMVKGDFSSEELTKAHIDACMDGADLNAFITTTFDAAMEAAKASDARRAKGEVGLLEGAPLGVKDLFCTEGVKTCAASKILGDFEPTYESTVTANMKADGMVMLGKLNLDEFAMGSSNETSAYGPVINPWKNDEDLVPGGSSGGSAAAVGPSVSPPLLPAQSGSSQPMAAVRVGARSPLPARSIKRDRLPKQSKIVRSCWSPWRAMTRKIRPQSMRTFRIGRLAVVSLSKVYALVFRKNIRLMACQPKSKRSGIRVLSG